MIVVFYAPATASAATAYGLRAVADSRVLVTAQCSEHRHALLLLPRRREQCIIASDKSNASGYPHRGVAKAKHGACPRSQTQT